MSTAHAFLHFGAIHEEASSTWNDDESGEVQATSWMTAAWLAQLVERQSAVREVDGSSPRPDQHSGS